MSAKASPILIFPTMVNVPCLVPMVMCLLYLKNMEKREISLNHLVYMKEIPNGQLKENGSLTSQIKPGKMRFLFRPRMGASLQLRSHQEALTTNISLSGLPTAKNFYGQIAIRRFIMSISIQG